MKPCEKISDSHHCPVLNISSPSGSVCRECPHYTGPTVKVGLGDRVESAINFVTLGQAKRVADKIARKRGKKDCGCDKRRDQLNTFGDSIVKKFTMPKDD
jgi:hypothetical protein